MGFVCPIHALYGPAHDEFDPLSNLINHVLFVIFVVRSSYDMYQICTRYLIELLFPRVRLVFCSACATHFERIREPSHSLRGPRWPEGNERFRGGRRHH